MAIIERRRELLGEKAVPIEKAFNACTMAEIAYNCENGFAQSLVDAGTWTIGDTNANATYGSYSGVRLVHVLTEEQRGSTYYGTTGHIVVEFVNKINATIWYTWAKYAKSYSESGLFSKLQQMYSSGLNSDFRNVLKSFSPSASVQSSSSSSPAETSVEHPSNYLHAANCVEMGSTNYYRPSENSCSFCFDYYNDSSTAASRRSKSGESSGYWLRSVSYATNATTPYYKAYLVYDDGATIDAGGDIGGKAGIAPICCI